MILQWLNVAEKKNSKSNYKKKICIMILNLQTFMHPLLQNKNEKVYFSCLLYNTQNRLYENPPKSQNCQERRKKLQ